MPEIREALQFAWRIMRAATPPTSFESAHFGTIIADYHLEALSRHKFTWARISQGPAAGAFVEAVNAYRCRF